MSFSGEGPRSSSLGLAKAGTTSSPPTIKPARPRTTSTTSSYGRTALHAHTFQDPGSAMSTATFSIILPDQSQKGLDRVLKSRLVETFLSITILNPSDQDPDSELASLVKIKTPPRRVRPAGPLSPTKDRPASPRNTKPTSNGRHSPSLSVSALAKLHADTQAGPSKSTVVQSPSTPERRPKSASPTASNFPASSSAALPSLASLTYETEAPAFLSDFHRPSTNPSFPISLEDFAPWADRAGHKLQVDVFGRVGSAWGQQTQNVSAKGKGKERSDMLDHSWKVLSSWSFDLSDLIPLDDVSKLCLF